MTTNGSTWEKWLPPYDPRWIDGTIVFEDEHHRFIETADCSRRCPGCGICCQGYRDEITEDYQGTEEHELNIRLDVKRGGLVELSDDHFYRRAKCGQSCPGNGQCCPPPNLMQHPNSVAEAQAVLLERDDSTIAELESALLFLAHDGAEEAVTVLEKYLPVAHIRIEGFAELALEEGRYFNSSPRSAEEEQRMLKKDVKEQYIDRICTAQGKIDEGLLHEIDLLAYELDAVCRAKEKAIGDENDLDWEMRIEGLRMKIGECQNKVDELRTSIERDEAILAVIEADLEIYPSEE